MENMLLDLEMLVAHIPDEIIDTMGEREDLQKLIMALFELEVDDLIYANLQKNGEDVSAMKVFRRKGNSFEMVRFIEATTSIIYNRSSG